MKIESFSFLAPSRSALAGVVFVLGSLGSLPVALADLDGGISMSNPQWLTESVRDREIDAVRHAADRIRLPINWDELQASSTTAVEDWNWDVYDDIINHARPATGKKLNVLVILGSVPTWANGGSAGDYGVPATDTDKFRNFCYQVAYRYLPLGVTAYQIGNEVNLIKGGWTPNGTDYHNKFLQPGATGVWQAAVARSLDYNVVMGSLAPITWNLLSDDPVEFLEDIYIAAGGNGPGNGKWRWGSLSYHPYVGPAADPPSGETNLATTPDDIYDVMLAYNEGSKKIWATEFGSPTHGNEYVTDEDVMPDWVDDVVDAWYSYSFAGPLFWYTARDKQAYGATTEREDYFGLLYSNFAAKPAYPVLKSYFNPNLENGTYQVLAHHSAKSLDVDNWGTANGTRVQQWAWHGGASQQWTFEKQADGSYEIKANTTTGMNLRLANTSSGTTLELWADDNSDSQRFLLQALGGGFYRITPKHNTAFALDVAGASTADGANVLQYTWYSTSLNQQWLIVPLFNY